MAKSHPRICRGCNKKVASSFNRHIDRCKQTTQERGWKYLDANGNPASSNRQYVRIMQSEAVRNRHVGKTKK